MRQNAGSRCTGGRTHRAARLSSGFFALLALAAFAGNAAAPMAPRRAELRPFEQIARWTAPPVNVPDLLKEDEAAQSWKDIPLHIGLPVATDLSPATSGTWENLADGGSIWRLSVKSGGALWIVLGFDVYRLQDRASLWVYDPALKTVLGPYTSRDVRDHGQLWTPPVEGDTLVVELDWPDGLRGVQPDVHLGTVSHGYKPFGSIGRALMQSPDKGLGDSGPCNVDVMCPLGAGWQNERQGVVLLLSGGAGACTASLVNTTANDCRPYVLTAHHCGPGPSTVFGFNWERPACGSGAPPPVTTYTVSGASLLADDAGSDFALLQMSSAPPESFNAYFNGWSRSSVAPLETHVIHHPEADVKKISYDSDPAVDGVAWGPSHWRIEHYTAGTTEPGSSGAPLFDQNHRIVGQLHGGTASCESPTWDEYGKLDVSWAGGGTVASRLSDWLDPNFTGDMFVDGVSESGCLFNPAGDIALGRSIYACADTLTITLRDGNLAGAAIQDVTVFSNTEPTAETVTLTARAPGATFFDGAFPLAPIPAVHGDGTLSVGPGDVVTVLYFDQDNGAGGTDVPVTATAQMDCTGPAVSSIRTQNVTGAAADILWSTDEPSDSRATYGTAIPPATVASSAALGVNHQVSLAGLVPCTTYFFSVSSTDALGNTTTDTAGGRYYTFTTGVHVSPTYTYPGPDTPIQEINHAGAAATINVPDDELVAKVVATVNITHTFDSDLTLHLIGPGGADVVLCDRRGSSGDNFAGTTFDDAAAAPIAGGTAPFTGVFRPDVALAAFNGTLARGTWTLFVVDNASGDTGAIQSWSLSLTYAPQDCGRVVSYFSSQTTDVCNGAGGGVPGRIDPGDTVALRIVAHDGGVAPATGVSGTLSTTTPGVTITDDHGSFGDLAPDGTAVSYPDDFEFELDPGFPCGAPIVFTIAFAGNEGTWPSSFSFPTGGPEQAAATFVSTDVPHTIFDNATVTSSVPVNAPGTVLSVQVSVSIVHTWDEDLTLSLTAPTGARVTLSNRRGGSGHNYTSTVFDDLAPVRIASGVPPYTGAFRPDAALSAFKNIAANGVWTLKVEDAAPPDTGTLMNWSLTLTTTALPACANCSPTVAGEARNAVWADAATLQWNPAVRATGYTVRRGGAETLPQLLTAGVDSCVRLTTANTTTGGTLTEIPSAGTLYWYLVLAHNASGDGTAGAATAGPRIVDSTGPCP